MQLYARAKVNLHLRVTGKRADGYHEIQSLMCPIALADLVILSPGPPGIGVSVAGGDGSVPETEENLAWKAASLFFKKLGKRPYLKIHIEKKIPAAAGLGGGSSNAAVVLKGLNRLHGNPFSLDELKNLALLLGADVPFFLGEGAAWAEGIGEVLKPVRNLKIYPLLLIKPPVGLSTAEVYKNLKWGLTKKGIKIKNPHFEGEVIDPLCWLHNDLEAVAARMCPDVEASRKIMEGLGAKGVLMSGSGPTVFGLFEEMDLAERACSLLQGAHPSSFCVVSVLSP